MSTVFKALSDPTRREILTLLRQGDLSAGEISDQFQMSKPAISKHLEILRGSELITSEKKGQYVVYSINLTVLQEALSGFLALFENSKSEGKECSLNESEFHSV